MGSPAAVAADRTASPGSAGPAKRSGQLVAFWCATGALYLTLIWLYGRGLSAPALALGDQPKLDALGRLSLFDAWIHAGPGPWRPGENALFWWLARSDRLAAGRAMLLGVALLTTGFVQAYATQRGESWIIGICSAWCFALNPTSTSVVCWLSGAHVGLCALGVLTYVECSQRLLTRAPSGRARAALWIGALAGLAFALAFYELAVLAPLLIVFYCALLRPRTAAHTPARLLAASAAFVAAYLALQVGAGAGAEGWFGDSAALRAASVLRYYFDNFMLWMWPWGQFGVRLPDAPSEAAVANVSCSALVLLTWAALWRLRRWDPTAVFGFAWFILFLIPAFALPEPIAPYHLYIPMLGFVFAGARITIWLLERMSTSIGRPRLRLTFDVMVSLFFLWTIAPLLDETARAVEAWSDEEQLYLLTVQNYPQNVPVLADLTEQFLATRAPAAELHEPSRWELLLDEILMRPPHEPAAELIGRGRAFVDGQHYAEGGSAFARALAAGAQNDDRVAASSGLADALMALKQPIAAAALRERLRSEPPAAAAARVDR